MTKNGNFWCSTVTCASLGMVLGADIVVLVGAPALPRLLLFQTRWVVQRRLLTGARTPARLLACTIREVRKSVQTFFFHLAPLLLRDKKISRRETKLE